MAPPQTWGWTPRAVRRPQVWGGSPTDVGMDPTHPPPQAGAARLPHRRGDGPDRRYAYFHRPSAPPQTWGWTSCVTALTLASAGSPTDVGMDPSSTGVSSRSARLPHRRGDGPASSAPDIRAARAPPQTWGWTRRRRPGRAGRQGSPTDVGMDLTYLYPAEMRYWLPHRRGDGPHAGGSPCPPLMAPPQTWGWTPRVTGWLCVHLGSPTDVGMDLFRKPPALTMPGLPHRRGDGPELYIGSLAAWKAPPQTWGWTLGGRDYDDAESGSPTDVGMDLGRSGLPRSPSWLPHRRGDGPRCSPLQRRNLSAPPQTWGWTCYKKTRRQHRVGSPTDVGMDLSRGSRSTHGVRLPHRRGDGPWRASSHVMPLAAPPQTWGWTYAD